MFLTAARSAVSAALSDSGSHSAVSAAPSVPAFPSVPLSVSGSAILSPGPFAAAIKSKDTQKTNAGICQKLFIMFHSAIPPVLSNYQ